jgi:hypothetical protein
MITSESHHSHKPQDIAELKLAITCHVITVRWDYNKQ